MTIKEGVKLAGLRPEMSFALQVCDGVFRRYDLEAVLTSGTEGKHRSGSKHYEGKAGDLRLPAKCKSCSGRAINNQGSWPSDWIAELQSALGSDFDVIAEADHIHVEWDPKAAPHLAGAGMTLDALGRLGAV